jgi:pimeloyl-ACP methyl ester carboxylesterase
LFIRVNDLNIHVRIDGPPGGAPVVLLHSLGTSALVWDAQAAALSRQFRVIRPDLRGHGLTECTPGPYSMALFAEDLAALLKGLKIEKTHLAGISIGGLIAQEFTAAHPKRVASLTLIDTAMAIPPPSSWTERAATVRAQGISVIEDAVIARWVTPDFLNSPATTHAGGGLCRGGGGNRGGGPHPEHRALKRTNAHPGGGPGPGDASGGGRSTARGDCRFHVDGDCERGAYSPGGTAGGNHPSNAGVPHASG